MTSTRIRRASQCLGATAFILAATFGSAALADAKPKFDFGGYADCIDEGTAPETHYVCCISFGGVWDPKTETCLYTVSPEDLAPPKPGPTSATPGKPGLTPVPQAPGGSLG